MPLPSSEMTCVDRDETRDNCSGAQNQDNEDGTVQKSGSGLDWRFDNLTVFFVHLELHDVADQRMLELYVPPGSLKGLSPRRRSRDGS